MSPSPAATEMTQIMASGLSSFADVALDAMGQEGFDHGDQSRRGQLADRAAARPKGVDGGRVVGVDAQQHLAALESHPLDRCRAVAGEPVIYLKHGATQAAPVHRTEEVGDGALGFWKALREVFPVTREQRCWFHVSSNVLAALPKSAHPGAKAALAEIYNAEDRDHALQAIKAFEADYGAKWPKAVAKITEHVDVLLAFYDYPAEHWIHLRTTNPIESTFATVRLRQRITKGPGSRAAGVAMAFKLIESAQARWRAVNAPHLVALVRAGARFEKGKLVERPDESGGDQQVA